MSISSHDTEKQFSFLVQNLHLGDLNPVKCGWHQRVPNGYWGPSIHSDYSFHFIFSGKGEYTVNGNTYTLEKNHMFLMRPDTITKYQADSENPWCYAWISFGGTAVDSILEKCGVGSDVCTIYCPDLFNIFDEFRHYPADAEVSAINLNAKLYTIFDRLSSENKPQIQKTPVAQYCTKAVDFIQANYQFRITIEGLSKNLGIDRRYFSRIFTKYIGVSPQQYLVDYRLERAKYLISLGSYSVSEVANSVGYDDIFAFSKIFKKKYGVSPSGFKTNKLK